ncbi:protein FAM196B-like [Silurus asotus]|uniref:Protein FAM196B-like n=1 Tax=Silurus asotus TaxID=30991 RepID=A0AAD5B374_SILAS|nr:protein FAM196B-like [Silurus asotus]
MKAARRLSANHVAKSTVNETMQIQVKSFRSMYEAEAQSVGVQTSPGLRSLPSLKRRSHPTGTVLGNSVPVETMSLDRAKPSLGQFRNCTSKVSQDETSQDGSVYCQIESLRTNPSQSGCRGNFKRNPRFINGSVVASELVEGVCSEGVETGEVGSQRETEMRIQKNGQSLKGEKTCPLVQCGGVRSYELTTKLISPEIQNASETKGTSQTLPLNQEQKSTITPETKPQPVDCQPLQKNLTEAQVPLCNGVPSTLHGLLQNIEENLLSNQEKIKVLLNVIQDLEKSKAMSEGVEHDFRLQEGRFQSVLEALDMEYDVPSFPKMDLSRPRNKNRIKKLRRKCFWWL